MQFRSFGKEGGRRGGAQISFLGELESALDLPPLHRRSKDYFDGSSGHAQSLMRRCGVSNVDALADQKNTAPPRPLTSP